MKKFIVTALAAGALTVGGAASAQDIGRVITDIIGLGTSLMNQGSQSAVTGQVYQDQYGRQFYYNQYGQQVYLQNTQQQQIVGYDSWGRPIYGTSSTQQIVGYDSWGRPIYGNSSIYGSNTYGGTYGYGGSAYGGSSYGYGGSTYGSSWDRDGDRVANSRDRWPDDPRYW